MMKNNDNDKLGILLNRLAGGLGLLMTATSEELENYPGLIEVIGKTKIEIADLLLSSIEMKEKIGIETWDKKKFYCEVRTYSDGSVKAVIDYADYDSLYHDGVGYETREGYWFKIFDDLKEAIEFANEKADDVICLVEVLKK